MSSLLGATLFIIALGAAVAVSWRMTQVMMDRLALAVSNIEDGKKTAHLSWDDWARRILLPAALASGVMGISLRLGIALLMVWCSSLVIGRLWGRPLVMALHRSLRYEHDSGPFWLAVLLGFSAATFGTMMLALCSVKASPGHALFLWLWLAAVLLLARLSRPIHMGVAIALFAILGATGYLLGPRSYEEISREMGMEKALGWRFKWSGPEK